MSIGQTVVEQDRWQAVSSRRPINLSMTPTSWHTGARSERICYAVAPCYLGHVLVAGTVRGICSIALGDDPDQLLSGLRERFPKAELLPTDDEFKAWGDTILNFIEAPGGYPDLPLDIQGTAFQQRVWGALRRIEPGTTVSYSDLAKMLGQPNAARAVARACASNRIAVAIPCHRVVRSDGGLAGYRWGSERKRALLQQESQFRRDPLLTEKDISKSDAG